MHPKRLHFTGFEPRSNRLVGAAAAVLVCAILGGLAGGWTGLAVGLVAAAAAVVVPWGGKPGWLWARLWWQSRRVDRWVWPEPITVANNRSGAGVRIHDGVAVVAVQLRGKAHAATVITGSVSVQTENMVDIAELAGQLAGPLGLQLDSMSVVSVGARRATTGDYPRVYDTEIGTAPYAGRRETWLILRLDALDNAEALQWRTTLGATAVACAQRVAAALRAGGLRARVATANDLGQLDRRLGAEALAGSAGAWKALRVEGGWVSTYAYPSEAITSAVLGQAWTWQADEIAQTITIYPDRTCTATVSVRTPQPAPTPPAVVLRRLDGQQAPALAASLCGPRPELFGLDRAALPESLWIEIGPSGVLVGKLRNGDRLLVPVTDAGELSRVYIAAEDPIAKRIVIRAAGGGERVSVHSTDSARWASVRMPEVAVVATPRPASRTTLSVTDGTIIPSPRPTTVITVAPAGTPCPPDAAEVIIEQLNRAVVRVRAGGREWLAEVELFRAENRYTADEALAMPAPLH